MKDAGLTAQLQALRALFDRVDAACGDDMEMRAHWAKYLCVLAAGFLEIALIEVYSYYCNKGANKAVASFARRNLERIQNPKSSRFVEITAFFSKEWGDNLRQFVDDKGRKEAIDSIMTNRHMIAHGKRSDITLVRAKEYLIKSIEVVEFIEAQCRP